MSIQIKETTQVTAPEVKSDYDVVVSITDKYDGNHDNLISILHDIQSEYHYLPESALRIVARELDLPLMQVYSVATFFKAFSLKPQGKHLVNVCLGTACHVRGTQSVLEEIKRQLGIDNGETTGDMQYTLQTVNCLGACALGPVVVIDGKYYGQMTPGKVKKILHKST